MDIPGYQKPDFWNECDRLIESGRFSYFFQSPIGDGKRKPGKYVLRNGKLVKVDRTRSTP